MPKDQQLIDRVKSAIETINQCSDQLAANDIFLYIRTVSKKTSYEGDHIELYDVILHKSLLKEPANNDSQ
jgi:hypothetical protein